jgi:hypothetical protein
VFTNDTGAVVDQSFDSWEEERDAFEKAGAKPQYPRIDVESPMPYNFEEAVVFVCLDVEVWEKDHHSITEVGVSTLDTLDLIGEAPGKNANNWQSKILRQHFRIAEHAHLVNKKYVSGCPENFDFGESEWISMRDAPAILTACLSPTSRLPSQRRSAHYALPDQAASGHELPKARNVILVGHDLNSDINYICNVWPQLDSLLHRKPPSAAQSIQTDLPQPTQEMDNLTDTQSSVIDTLDTANMYRVLTRDSNPRQLAILLAAFDIVGWNLHNAGNDAAYTLHIMLAIALRAAEHRKTSIVELAVQHVEGNDAAIEEEGEDVDMKGKQKLYSQTLHA